MNRILSLAAAAALVAACQAAPAPSIITPTAIAASHPPVPTSAPTAAATRGVPVPSASMEPSARASTPATSSLVPTTTASTARSTLMVCHDGDRCPVPPGSYITDVNGFFPGLEVTIPAGWYLGEQDPGELALYPDDGSGNRLLLWKDVRVVTSTHESGPTRIVAEVDRTPEAFVDWFTNNDNFNVIREPKTADIGGTSGQTFAVQVSETANYAEPDCPSNPRCADFVTDPAHWGSNSFGVGGDGVVQLYVATVPYANGDHLFAVAWDALTPEFEALAQPVIYSLRVPAEYVSN